MTNDLNLALHRGICRRISDSRSLSVGVGFIGIVAETGKPLVSANLRYDLLPASGGGRVWLNRIACIPLFARVT
jgi:hypothetical protein